MNGRVMLAHTGEYGSYSGGAEQLAVAAGALIIYANSARIDAALAARLTRLGQLAFGVCALLFGGAHFFYMNLTAPLVPKWLPPGQVFWAYATGVAHIAGGLAILTGVRARLAATTLTVMFASFTPLEHLPMLLADPSKHFNWSENALNLALVGSRLGRWRIRWRGLSRPKLRLRRQNQMTWRAPPEPPFGPNAQVFHARSNSREAFA